MPHLFYMSYVPPHLPAASAQPQTKKLTHYTCKIQARNLGNYQASNLSANWKKINLNEYKKSFDSETSSRSREVMNVLDKNVFV